MKKNTHIKIFSIFVSMTNIYSNISKHISNIFSVCDLTFHSLSNDYLRTKDFNFNIVQCIIVFHLQFIFLVSKEILSTPEL